MEIRSKPWPQALKNFCDKAVGVANSKRLREKYADLFSADYQALISPRYALNDMLHCERVLNDQREEVSFLKPDKKFGHYRLHFYTQKDHYLDEFIPVLENVNLRVLDQVQFRFSLANAAFTIKSFTIKPATDATVSFRDSNQQMMAMIRLVMAGRLENDALNKLAIMTGMGWQDCDVLRTYRNYYLQLDHRTTKASIHHALLANPTVAKSLFEYFEARFRPHPDWRDPMVREEQVLFGLRLQLLENMASVKSINDDRILRIFFNLIDATVRSNFHKRRFHDDYFIAIKINSLGVIDMPAPRPHYEIYVHASDMEAIHLRGGKISRGGIRWSDRIDDFRTEILDLMQTQISKNALIIPTGAKGGFVLKKVEAGLDFKTAGQNAYIRFMHGLLDLTDNYCADDIVSPPDVIAHDDSDPYLVVAADKGTAKFSDIANSVAAEYGFWLGDAFASGGSHGYDHKALGITARGAWECVKRHFREIGKDIQTEPFTVIGIGSMDGDVFGNGMLLSPQIRLLAAFSGQHIFIDPNPPTSAAPFQERRRLFELPGSTWNDYDRTLISSGGGVYARTDKDIALSTEVKQWLGIRFKSIDGESLIQYLLKSRVELLWLGGIGTYVKASFEKHEDVGDHANDNVRIDATELRATVVGEGANLGFTQKARVEYALRGGRINTDAVDNSAGVDTSDHEVNLKILLSNLHKKQVVADYQQLFTDMTDAVCQAVLADNIAQSLCLSLEQRRCADNSLRFCQVADRLESSGFLDRAVESFPLTKEIQSRPRQALTRPELAVLMAAAKMYLTRQLENHPALFQADCYRNYLEAYFPAACREQFQAHLASHPLADAIKATVISNLIINQAGCGFLSLDDTENGNLPVYVSHYLTFDRILDGSELRQAIARLDNQIPTESQYQCLLDLENTLGELCRVSSAQLGELHPAAETVSQYRQFLADFAVYQQGDSEYPIRVERYQQYGMPAALAAKMALVANLEHFLFMVTMAQDTGQDFASLGRLLDSIDQALGTRALAQQLAQIPLRDHWVSGVRQTLLSDIQQASGQLLKYMLHRQTSDCAKYLQQNADVRALKRYHALYQENKKTTPVNLLAYVLLARALGNLAAGD